jgi:hypothetical protein
MPFPQNLVGGIKMTKIYNSLIFIGLMIFFLCASNTRAATINASSCSEAHVQYAINSASSGDTVLVPNGTCIWSSGITVPQGITLAGQGIGHTVISTSSFINVVALSDNSRLTAFEFTNGYASGNYHQDWAVDNCKMQSPSSLGTVNISGVNHAYPPTGVYHKCTISNIRFVLFGTGTAQDWYDVLPLGSTTGVVYIEGCTISSYGMYTNGIDSNYGARKVLRFNKFYNTPVGSHGGRAASGVRGTRRHSMYRNTFNHTTYPGTSEPSYAWWHRGGDGVLFDNNCMGDAGRCEYAVDFERAYEASKVICNSLTGYETVPHPEGGLPNYL